jgi:hypothetical protein
MEYSFQEFFAALDELCAAMRAKVDSDLEAERARLYADIERINAEARAKAGQAAVKFLERRVATADPSAGVVRMKGGAK